MTETINSDRDNDQGKTLSPPTTNEGGRLSIRIKALIEDVDNELVRDWMTRNPISVRSESSLIDTSWLMIEHNIRRLPVIDNGTLVGIITLEDIRRLMPPDAIRRKLPTLKATLSGLTVGEIMTPDPVTISQNAWLVDAAKLMLDNKISTLPVVDGDVVVGIITERDIFRGMVELCLD